MKKAIHLLLALGLLLLAVPPSLAQRPIEFGMSLGKVYMPSQYVGHTQNWAAAQDERGVLYFANGSGLLEYDGHDWKLHDLLNYKIVRSLAFGPDGLLYVGSVGDFGYMEPDALGSLRYVSLSSEIPELPPFADLWSVHAVGQDMFFLCDDFVLRYRPDAPEGQRHELLPKQGSYFFLGFNVGGSYYVSEVGVGVRRYGPNGLELVAGTEALANDRIYAVLRDQGERLLLSTRANGLLVLMPEGDSARVEEQGRLEAAGGPFARVRSQAAEFLASNPAYQIKALNDSVWVINTTARGTLLLGRDGRFLQAFNQNGGLPNDFATFSLVAAGGELWVTLGNGIAKLEVSGPWTHWDNTLGLDGNVYAIERWRGRLYVGTSAGLYYLRDNISPAEALGTQGGYSFFKKFEEFDGQAWGLLRLSDPGRPGAPPDSASPLVLASSGGIFQVHPDRLEPIDAEESGFCVFQSRLHPGTVYVGQKRGIGVLHYGGGRWTRVGHYTNFNNDIRYIEEDGQGNLWVGTNYDGVYRIGHSELLWSDRPVAEATFLEKLEVARYDTASGFPTVSGNKVFRYQGQVVFGSSSRYFRYDLGLDSIVEHQELNAIFQRAKVAAPISLDADGNLFPISPIAAYRVGEGFRLDTSSYRRLLAENIIVNFVEPGAVWYGNANGLYRLAPSRMGNPLSPFRALVRQVRVGRDSLVFEGNFSEPVPGRGGTRRVVADQPSDFLPELDYASNTVAFRFSSTFFQEEDLTEYSYWLEGFDEDWSEWSSEAKKEYTNLPEGPYVFRVKARNLYGQESLEHRFAFRVLPPWYRTAWAYLGYGVLFLGLVYGVVRLSLRRLEQKNQELEAIVLQRTSEIRHKNTELEQQKEEIQSQAEQLSLANSELGKLSLVASKTDNAVLIMDGKGNFQWVNEGYTRMFGLRLEELVSRTPNIIGPDTQPEVAQSIRRCIQTRKPVSYELAIRHKNGSVVWVQTTLSPVVGELGQVETLVAIDSEITKLKEAEQEISEQRDELGRQNEAIKDSIRYGLTIQQAMLPTRQALDRFADNFVLFKPKDIVSGDFYWYARLERREGFCEKHFIAAIDCTGHGVPGAFMSMIGNRLLNEIVNERKTTDPAEVLDLLDQGVVKALKQETSENSDGMDVCLCRVDRLDDGGSKVFFSGAKRNLVVGRAQGHGRQDRPQHCADWRRPHPVRQRQALPLPARFQGQGHWPEHHRIQDRRNLRRD